MAEAGKVKQTETAILRRWDAQEGGWAVVEVRSLFGLPVAYLSVCVAQAGEYVASRHRKPGPAFEAAERKAR